MEEKLKIENNRTSDNLSTIYLFREGEWYNAFEWSAFLVEFYNNNLDVRLKPTHKHYNKVGDVIKVGLKTASFKKYLPDIISVDASNIDCLIYKVDLSKFDNINFDTWKDKLKKWKESIEITSKNKKEKNTAVSVYSRPENLFNIISELIKFDSNNKTNEEVINFIQELRNKSLTILFG